MFALRPFTLSILAGFVALSTGCALTPTASTQITYENTIRHLIEKQCFECHGSKAPVMSEFKKDEKGYEAKDIGPRMDTYEHLIVMINGSDTGAIMRRLDDGTHTKNGKPGNMYKNLGSNDTQRAANLSLFKSWIGSWNLKRAKEMNDEERKSILIPRN
ncbi:MAG: hypothetical protein Q8O31_05780 [Rhodocyclaceae bacterium]|nr:hypothetical protein [Rhodocyclaceae bacterium]